MYKRQTKHAAPRGRKDRCFTFHEESDARAPCRLSAVGGGGGVTLLYGVSARPTVLVLVLLLAYSLHTTGTYQVLAYCCATTFVSLLVLRAAAAAAAAAAAGRLYSVFNFQENMNEGGAVNATVRQKKSSKRTLYARVADRRRHRRIISAITPSFKLSHQRARDPT